MTISSSSKDNLTRLYWFDNVDIARLDCNLQENQMTPLLQREALLKYCLEQYRNSNTKYQESVWLILQYWQCNITIALQMLRYLYCNIGIAYLMLNWIKLYKRRGSIDYTKKKRSDNEIGSGLRIAIPSTGSWVFTFNAVSLLKHELNHPHGLNIKLWLQWVTFGSI